MKPAVKRPRKHILLDRAFAVVATLCAAYPAYSIFDNPPSELDFSRPITWFVLLLISASLASFLYHVAITPSLKYPVYKQRHNVLDQLEHKDTALIHIPTVVKVFGWLAIIAGFSSAAFISYLVINLIRNFDFQINNPNDLELFILIPAGVISAVLVLRTVFKTRIAPAAVVTPPESLA